MSTTRDERIYNAWHGMKRRGHFHYDTYGSPYYLLARKFAMPVIQVRGIVNEMKQRRQEELARGRWM